MSSKSNSDTVASVSTAHKSSISAEERTKKEMLDAARKKLKSYRKKTASKHRSRSSITSSSSVSSSAQSISSSSFSPANKIPRSVSGTSITSNSSSPASRVHKRGTSSTSSIKSVTQHARKGSLSALGHTRVASHTRKNSILGLGVETVEQVERFERPARPVSLMAPPKSTTFISAPQPRRPPSMHSFHFPPLSASSSAGASPSTSCISSPASSLLTNLPSPALPARPSSVNGHRHRRSLSVSTKRESFDIMILPPDSKDEEDGKEDINEVRRRALESLEGRGKGNMGVGLGIGSSSSHRLSTKGDQLILPDLNDDNAPSMLDTLVASPRPSSRSNLTKRDSFGKLLPNSVLLSLQSVGDQSPLLGLPLTSPRVTGEPAGLIGILEEEEEDEYTHEKKRSSGSSKGSKTPPRASLEEQRKMKSFSFGKPLAELSTPPTDREGGRIKSFCFPTSDSPIQPSPTSTTTPPPSSASSTTPVSSSRRPLRPLTLKSGSQSAPTASGRRPLSLSLASSTSTPPHTSIGSIASQSSQSSSSFSSSPTESLFASRYAGLGRGRPSLSSSSTASPAGGSSPMTPLALQLGDEKRRSSISYKKTSGSDAMTSSDRTRSIAACPPRRLSTRSNTSSFSSNGMISPEMKMEPLGNGRVLTEVGEEDEADGQGDEDKETTVFSAQQQQSLERKVTPSSISMVMGRSTSSTSSHPPFSFARHRTLLASTSSPEESEFPSPPSPDNLLVERLRHAESERDSLLEDVEGWRERISGLEETLRDERKASGVERDLARERIRKLGDRVTSLANTNASSQASFNQVAAQERLVSEMRDQIFALASSLARAEEARKAVEDALREEKDSREIEIERRVSEMVASRLLEMEKTTRLPTPPSPNHPSPPFIQQPFSKSNFSTSSSNSAFSGFSFGGNAMSRTQSGTSSYGSVTDIEEVDESEGTKQFGWTSRTSVDMRDFGIVAMPGLESLVEEDEDEEGNESSDASLHQNDSKIEDALLNSSFGSTEEMYAKKSYIDEPPVAIVSPPSPVDDAKTPLALAGPSTINHPKRASLQRTWRFPEGPVLNPVIEDFKSSLILDAEEEEVVPFGAWIVPKTPEVSEFSTFTDANGVVQNVAKSPISPQFPQGFSTYSAGGPGASVSSLLPRAFSQTHTPAAKTTPPVSRSASYNVSISSSSTAAPSIAPSTSSIASRLSFTSMASTLGQFVFTGPSNVGPAALCKLDKEYEDDDDRMSMGQSSGQWVVRSHSVDSMEGGFSAGHRNQWSITKSPPVNASKALLPSGSRPKSFVEAKDQLKAGSGAMSSPLWKLDFRGTCGHCSSQVIEL